MPTHRYRAVTAQGRIRRGETDAASLAELEARLARAGLTLISAEARSTGGLPRRRIPRRELIHFCFQLEHLIAAGVPILDALSDLRATIPHPRFRRIVADLVDGIEGGQTLSEACAAHHDAFDPVFVGLLRAGEQAGRLPQVLKELAVTLERADGLAAHARRIAIYPAFVLAILLIAVGVALVFVVPELGRLLQGIGQTLPLQTRLLVSLSALVKAHGVPLAGLAAATLVGLRIAIARLPAARVRYEAALLRLPVCGPLLRTMLLTRLCRTLGMMYEAGIPIVDALRSAADTAGNAVVRGRLEEAGARITAGETLSHAIAGSALFPPLLVRMLHVGEQSGTLDTALGHLGRYYERKLEESIARLQAAIEPLLTVLLGGLMLWIMSAVLGPIYDVLGRLPL